MNTVLRFMITFAHPVWIILALWPLKLVLTVGQRMPNMQTLCKTAIIIGCCDPKNVKKSMLGLSVTSCCSQSISTHVIPCQCDTKCQLFFRFCCKWQRWDIKKWRKCFREDWSGLQKCQRSCHQMSETLSSSLHVNIIYTKELSKLKWIIGTHLAFVGMFKQQPSG